MLQKIVMCFVKFIRFLSIFYFDLTLFCCTSSFNILVLASLRLCPVAHESRVLNMIRLDCRGPSPYRQMLCFDRHNERRHVDPNFYPQ
jgi:hypothetical protein